RKVEPRPQRNTRTSELDAEALEQRPKARTTERQPEIANVVVKLRQILGGPPSASHGLGPSIKRSSAPAIARGGPDTARACLRDRPLRDGDVRPRPRRKRFARRRAVESREPPTNQGAAAGLPGTKLGVALASH